MTEDGYNDLVGRVRGQRRSEIADDARLAAARRAARAVGLDYLTWTERAAWMLEHGYGLGVHWWSRPQWDDRPGAPAEGAD